MTLKNFTRFSFVCVFCGINFSIWIFFLLNSSEKESVPLIILETSTTASSPQPRYILVDDSERVKRNDSTIYFLFWNKFQGFDPTWGLPKKTSSPEDLASVNCPNTNCIFTSQKDLLSNIHDFDVLFITSWWEKVLELPKTRHPSQFYVLGNNE